jgi:hypothetical protein
MFLARVARAQKALGDDAPPAIRLQTHATALRSAGEHPKVGQERDHPGHVFARHPDDTAGGGDRVRGGDVRLVNATAGYQREITGPIRAERELCALALTRVFLLMILCPRGDLPTSHTPHVALIHTASTLVRRAFGLQERTSTSSVEVARVL